MLSEKGLRRFGPRALIGENGVMNCRQPDKRDRVGPAGTRLDTGFDLKAVRTGIGAALRTLHSDVLYEEVTDRIAELLRQLDQQKDVDSARVPNTGSGTCGKK